MKRLFFIYIIVKINFVLFAESDVRAVKAEYERCLSQMERTERTIRKYEELIKSLQEKSKNIKDNINLTQEISTLENRLEYFLNRYERARGQSEKINSDLKEVKGPVCPSCIESSVNLYCRNSETLQNELEDYISKASDVEIKLNGILLKIEDKKNNKLDSESELYENNRQRIDSIYKSLDICGDSVAVTFNLQIKKNIIRADSLYKNKEVKSAFKVLKVIEILIEKISKHCSGIK